MYPHENRYDPKAIKRAVLERRRKIQSNFSYSRFNIEHALYYRYLICREIENRFCTCKGSLSFCPRKEYNIAIEDPFVKGKWIFSRFNFSFMSYIYLCILSMVIHSIATFLETQTYGHWKFETATPTILHLKNEIFG